MRKRSVRRIAAVILLPALFAIYVYRVVEVNTSVAKIRSERYSMNEAVALEGAFFESRSMEETDNYEVKVVGARRMSPSEYMRAVDINVDQPDSPGEEEAIVCLEVAINNKGDGAGSFNTLFAILAAEDGSQYLVPDTELWSRANPGIESGQYVVSVRPHTEYVAKIPYAINSSSSERYAARISANEFCWAASDFPVKKVVKVSIEEE